MIKDIRLYLEDILESIALIESYVSGLEYDSFSTNRQVQDAIVKRLDKDFRESHPELPWKGMVGLRDVLVHDYDKVILEELWQLIHNGDLHSVKDQVTKVLLQL